MKTEYDIQFKDGIPRVPNMGRRGKPSSFVEVQHPDGTLLYTNETTYETAVEFLLLNSKFNQSDAKYIGWLYLEHILDVKSPEMFQMIMEDFTNWHEFLTGKK